MNRIRWIVLVATILAVFVAMILIARERLGALDS